MTVQTSVETQGQPPRAATAIIEITSHGLPATSRCVRCAVAQAYVEVEVFDHVSGTKMVMEFCAHHYNLNELALMEQAVRIVDYRPFLRRLEKGSRTKDDRR